MFEAKYQYCVLQIGGFDLLNHGKHILLCTHPTKSHENGIPGWWGSLRPNFQLLFILRHKDSIFISQFQRFHYSLTRCQGLERLLSSLGNFHAFSIAQFINSTSGKPVDQSFVKQFLCFSFPLLLQKHLLLSPTPNSNRLVSSSTCNPIASRALAHGP